MTNPNWNWRPLGDLFDIGAGKTMSEAARAGTDKVPFLRTSNVLWDEIDLTQVDEMSISPTELVDKSLKVGDLLVCEGGEVGRAAIWDGRVPVMSFQNHLHRLRPIRNDVDARFYVYFLQSAFTQLGIFEGAGNQTTIPNLSRNRLAALHVPHPSVAEQRSIARSLAQVRDGIAVHERSISLALELKQAVISNLFARGVRHEAQKETEIGLLPASWDVARLEDLAEAISKGASPKWQGFSYVPEGVLFVRSQNVDDGFVDLSEKVYLPGEWNAKEKRSVLRSGDLLLNLVGASIGRSAVGGVEIEGANCNQAVCFVRLRKEGVHPNFVNGFLQTREGQRQIHGSKKDIARANLSLEDVRQIVVPVAPITDQLAIVAILDALDQKIDLHKKKRGLLVELFKSLLQKLMTGEVSAADLDYSALPQEAAA